MASKDCDSQVQDLELHRCAFENNGEKIKKLLDDQNQICHINTGDNRGNTPLHIATILGHEEIVEMLLNHNATVDVENEKYQKPLNEAISCGNKAIITSLLKKLQEQNMENALAKRELLTDFLNNSRDFSLNFYWRFRDNRYKTFASFDDFAAEQYSLTKKGNCLRMNLTMIDPNEHLDLNASLLYNGDDPNLSRALCLLDHDCKEYQWIYHRSIHSVETDVDFLMSSSNITAKLKLKPQKELKRKAKGGIHAYKIILHTMKSLKTSETVRNEHLPKERKQKALSSPPMDTIAEDSVEAKSTSRFENEPKKVTGTRLGSGSSSSDGELSNESPNESGSESGSESKRESKRKCESRSKSRSRSRSTEGRLKENQASTSSGKSESATLREQSTTELPTTPKKRSSPNRISKFVNSFRKKSDSSSPSSSQATFQAPMLGAISWTKYESSSKKIGRKNKKKTMQQSEDVELELTAEFELKKEELEMILSCFNVLAHFKKLQDVINLVEDELVPVAVETDVSALYTGRVKLKNFKWRENITDSEDITDTAQFEIPDEYTENPLRIQGLGF